MIKQTLSEEYLLMLSKKKVVQLGKQLSFPPALNTIRATR
jgi:hypothetical protein